MIAMRHQETDAMRVDAALVARDGAALAAGPCALPDAPLDMPVQRLERAPWRLWSLFGGPRARVPASGN